MTAGNSDAGDGSTRPVAALRPPFEFTLQAPPQPVAPGGYGALRLRIRNRGEVTARYRLDLRGFPPDWAQFEPLTAPLAPGAESSQVILLRPERHPDYPPGAHRLVLRVTPEHAPQFAREEEFALQLLPGGGFGMALAQHDGELQLLLHNHGNAPLALQLRAPAPAGSRGPSLPPGPLSLAAGEQRSLPLRAGRRPLVGRRRALQFTVEARSLDEAAFVLALPARLPLVPLLDRRRFLLALLLLPAIALAAYLHLGVTPVILDFRSNGALVARGAALELEWQVRDATALQLEVNGQLRDIPPESADSGMALDTSEMHGEMTLALLAHKGLRSAGRSLTVTIYEPAQVNDFSAQPPTLLRHVVQPLTLRWEVSGARELRLEGPQPFAGRDLSAVGASGALEGLALPLEDALTLTLVAVDAAGRALEETLTLPAAMPTCAVTVDSLALHDEPQAEAPSLAQLETGSRVAVDGRDPTGDWLHLPGEEPDAWALLDGLDCEGFAPQDLRVLEPGRG